MVFIFTLRKGTGGNASSPFSTLAIASMQNISGSKSLIIYQFRSNSLVPFQSNKTALTRNSSSLAVTKANSSAAPNGSTNKLSLKNKGNWINSSPLLSYLTQKSITSRDFNITKDLHNLFEKTNTKRVLVIPNISSIINKGSPYSLDLSFHVFSKTVLEFMPINKILVLTVQYEAINSHFFENENNHDFNLYNFSYHLVSTYLANNSMTSKIRSLDCKGLLHLNDIDEDEFVSDFDLLKSYTPNPNPTTPYVIDNDLFISFYWTTITYNELKASIKKQKKLLDLSSNSNLPLLNWNKYNKITSNSLIANIKLKLSSVGTVNGLGQIRNYSGIYPDGKIVHKFAKPRPVAPNLIIGDVEKELVSRKCIESK